MVSEGSRVLAWSEIESPVGPILLTATKKGLCRLDFSSEEQARLGIDLWARRWIGSVQIEKNDLALLSFAKQLQEYFKGGNPHFEIPLDLYGTSFQKLVWEQLQTIPYGELRSYKDMAAAMGAPKAVRAVGGANNKNPVSIVVPCHRVIGSNGSLVGYGSGLKIKEFLLTLEGASPFKAEA
ncbi:methylated-DNA-[protein]-cysteine S-methyltransferase/epoxyqueuosine reductase [Marininema mesophilum]|uniref:Methylated-DNA--protein-cysteine methyltransferase n=1 Tax=Marininema mesophilum TaxID=1048340 RepID=A0A1H3C827_9BACL|nr:methylated-DNA--[protein]-cysteine S-methyltransferase [Marininema mesophilum]SDX49814.1 methylated-DNA-[protein]-cysteine S-methyltransferase/epoxyqueuosine reductase [Marininema mesophilum]